MPSARADSPGNKRTEVSGAHTINVDRRALRIGNSRLSAVGRSIEIVHIYAKRRDSNTLCASGGYAREKYLTTDLEKAECYACIDRARVGQKMDAAGINNPKAVRPVERKPVQPHENVDVCPTCDGRGVKAMD